MNMVKAVFTRIWALWALVSFVVTMFIFLIPIIAFCFTVAEPKSTFRFGYLSRIWMTIWLFLIGCPITIRGRKHFIQGEQYIVICNHNALMDIPASYPYIPGGNKTIAKSEFARVPIFGALYTLGSVLVDRKSDKSRKESFQKMKAVLESGLNMCIYPEGTRNKTSEPLKHFHDGAFRLALDTGKSIIPGVIFNTRIVNPADKVFYLMPHKLLVDFLPPIVPKEDDTIETLKARAWKIMNERLKH